MRDIWHKYHSWYFKIVSNFTRLTAREIMYNKFRNITCGIYAKYHFKSCYYLYLLINIPGEISHKNMISSHVKITCYLHTGNDHCCYGYMINCTFCNRNNIEVKCFGISLVFIIINETLHGCLEIWNLFACSKYFSTEREISCLSTAM